MSCVLPSVLPLTDAPACVCFSVQLTDEYVRPLIKEGTAVETLPDNIFASKPSAGAALLKLDL